MRDRTAVELLVTHALVAVLPDGLIGVGLAVERGAAQLLSRELPFARERIWTAMTHPDHVNRWWGPDGFRNEDVEMDFRVGGLWRYTMHAPDGKDWPNWIRYKSIVPPELITYDHGGEMSEPAPIEKPTPVNQLAV